MYITDSASPNERIIGKWQVLTGSSQGKCHGQTREKRKAILQCREVSVHHKRKRKRKRQELVHLSKESDSLQAEGRRGCGLLYSGWQGQGQREVGARQGSRGR